MSIKKSGKQFLIIYGIITLVILLVITPLKFNISLIGILIGNIIMSMFIALFLAPMFYIGYKTIHKKFNYFLLAFIPILVTSVSFFTILPDFLANTKSPCDGGYVCLFDDYRSYVTFYLDFFFLILLFVVGFTYVTYAIIKYRKVLNNSKQKKDNSRVIIVLAVIEAVVCYLLFSSIYF